MKLPSLLAPVAHLAGVPGYGPDRGEVEAVVEPLGQPAVLVEFAGDKGPAYAMIDRPGQLVVLRRRRNAA